MENTKICTCRECGWVGNLSDADNGEYEPPTCLMCESSSLSMQELQAESEQNCLENMSNEE